MAHVFHVHDSLSWARKVF